MTRTIAGWPEYSAEEIDAVSGVLKAGKVNAWTGDVGREFEREYADHCEAKFAIALSNGSVALDLALEAAGVGPGDEVIVTPRSFIASASCAIRVGATPVFADVDADSQNITAESIEAVRTSNTKAIIPVHHAGWPCDMDPIMRLAEKHDLLVIEDCAQAHGATYRGRPVGGIGHIGAFSFCQDKIITTGGEGGMLVTGDEQIWKAAWALKEHGKSFDAVFNRDDPPGFRWLHETIGTNGRMTEMQAAIGRLQLVKLRGWSARRTENAKQLAAALQQYPSVRVPMPNDDLQHAYYRLYAFIDQKQLRDGWSRERILEEFSDRGIPVGSGTCPAIYDEKAFGDLNFVPSGPLPIATSLGPGSLAFAVHPNLTIEDMQAYCTAVREVIAAASVA